MFSKIERLRVKFDGNGIELISLLWFEWKWRWRKVVIEEDEVSYIEGEVDVEEGVFLKLIVC